MASTQTDGATAIDQANGHDGNGDAYTGANIRVLEGIEAIRMRPGMYIGDTDTARAASPRLRGRRQLDRRGDGRLLPGRSTVTIHVDGSISVIDDGRGIPVDLHAESGKSTLEIVLTKVHAGGKFDHDTYKVSGGLHGVGVTAVNALSEWLEAEVRRDGQVWRQDFEQGEATGPVQAVGPAKKTGTKITFLPDAEIFPEHRRSTTTSWRSGSASCRSSTRGSASA